MRWRLRRGMKELDVLFERYAGRRYEGAPASEQHAFASLLTHEDPEIWAWVMDYTPAPEEFAPVIAQIRYVRRDA